MQAAYSIAVRHQCYLARLASAYCCLNRASRKHTHQILTRTWGALQGDLRNLDQLDGIFAADK